VDDEVRRAAQALVDKLDVVHCDSRYIVVWALAKSHLGEYSGPRYTDELAALKKALKK
jgi:hypothetical protein